MNTAYFFAATTPWATSSTTKRRKHEIERFAETSDPTTERIQRKAVLGAFVRMDRLLTRIL